MKCLQCLLDIPPDSTFCNRCGSIVTSDKQGMSSSTQTLGVEIKELPIESLFAGRYRIIQKIGTGGMGVVYTAEDTKLKRNVALKLIRPEFTVDREARNRFMLEAQVAASLDHPNICTVFEISQAEGQDFITMALIDGQSLDKKIESGALEPEEAIDVGIQVADGLNEAQEKGIIHRDIKSANIMLTRKGQAKIMDFGLAKLTEGPGVTKTTKIVGTVAYMSPEQAKGERVDSRSDIWSLGVVIYEMLTGQPPFKKESGAGVLYGIINENPKSVRHHSHDIPVRLGNIVDKCLEKNPAQRYQTAADLARDLKSAKQDLIAGKRIWRIPFLTYRLWKRLRKMAIPAAIVALISLLLLFLPSTKLMIKNWVAFKKARPEAISAPISPVLLTSEPPMVRDVAEGEETARISKGANDKTAPGQTGQIYYTKHTGSEETKESVAQFIVKEVMPEESRIEIAEQKEAVKPGYLIEFDHNPRGALFVDTDPDRAALYLDDQYKGMTDARLMLNPGIYSLKIKAKNYQEVTDMINIAPGTVMRKPYRLSPLLPQSGTLLIESTPSGAEVFLGIEDKPIGNTPLDKVMTPGHYTGKIRMPTYEDMPFEINVKPGKIAYEKYSLVSKNSTLIIDSTPQDAEVFLDGSEIPAGRTRFVKELPPKEYKIKIKKDGFVDHRETIIIQLAETVERNYPLTPMKQTSSPRYNLVVYTVPTDATVYINGKLEGKSPREVSLNEPYVILKVEKDNYRPFEKALTLTESPHVESIPLEKIGAGVLVISADPPAAVEINGKPIEGRVPPIKTIGVPAGENSVTFVLDEYGVYEKKLTVKDGDKLPVNFKFEQWMLSQRGWYSVTAFSQSLPAIGLDIDGRLIGDGKVPPRKKRWVEEGEHHIKCALNDKTSEYAVVEINDFIKSGTKKKINFLAEREEIADLKNTDLPEELSKKIENDWITVKSNTALEVDVDGKSYSGLTARSGFLEDSVRRHELKIKTGNPTVDHLIEISILKIGIKRLYKINITLGILK